MYLCAFQSKQAIFFMELTAYILLFAVSIFVLVKASDWFVDAAENVGLSLGVSPFIIGVTVVAFGTSLPELAASIAAVLAGSSEIVIGNVVGSNITNILLVLGLTVVLGKEIKLDFDVMDVDMPLLIASSFFLWFTLLDQQISMSEAILFLVALVIFLLNSFFSKRDEDDGKRPKIQPKDILMLIGGGVLIYLGATYTIVSIEKISIALSFPSEIIALTGVALGTSLPEVVVSITAAKKGKTGMAVGNVLGSNIFNTYAVMGIPALIGDLIIPDQIMAFSLPLMVAVSLLFGLVCLSGRISRWEGLMLVVFYIYFIWESIVSGLT